MAGKRHDTEIFWKWYKIRARLTGWRYKKCPTCGRSGPPRSGGRFDFYTGPDEPECTACGIARHYGWFAMGR